MKRQPRKLKWTKTHRALRGKEMVVDQNLLLTSFAKRRNVPVKYDRELVAQTVKAMERIEEIRAKRERVFARRRLRGRQQKERVRRENLKTVAEGGHLIRKELQDMEQARQEGVEMVAEVEGQKVMGEERMRVKRKRKMLVGGGTEEEMDVD